jgi:hypothetical protein
VAAYAERAMSKFEGTPSTMAVAKEALKMVDPAVRDEWMRRVASVESLEPFLSMVPSNRMSEASASFAEAVFQCNRPQLCDTP